MLNYNKLAFQSNMRKQIMHSLDLEALYPTIDVKEVAELMYTSQDLYHGDKSKFYQIITIMIILSLSGNGLVRAGIGVTI